MTRHRSSDYKLLFGLFFRLLPYQVLLIVISAVNGIVDSLYVSNILNGFLCAAVITAGAWAALKRFPRSLEDQMAIPETFGAEEDQRIDITVRNMDEVMQVSGQVIDFCEKRGIDRRRTFLAGLCMEEMAGDVSYQNLLGMNVLTMRI